MSLIVWIIVGAVAGWLASMVMKTDAQMGLISNIIVGMIGSLIGGALVVFLDRGDLALTEAFTNFNLASVLVSTLGAIVLIGLVKMFSK